MKRLMFLGLLIAIVIIAMVGCGESAPQPQPGSLSVYVSDNSPPANFSKIELTINEVDVTVDTGLTTKWIPVSTAPVKVNILDLRFAERLLGTIQPPSGTYRKIRLKIGVDGATAITAEVTGCYLNNYLNNSEVILDLNGATVAEGTQSDLLVDIDAGKIIATLPTGTVGAAPYYWQFSLYNEAFRVALKNKTATIRGHLQSNSYPAYGMDNAKVELQQNGITIFTTYSLSAAQNGAVVGDFIFKGIPPGSYSIKATHVGPNCTGSTAAAQFFGAGISADLGTIWLF